MIYLVKISFLCFLILFFGRLPAHRSAMCGAACSAIILLASGGFCRAGAVVSCAASPRRRHKNIRRLPRKDTAAPAGAGKGRRLSAANSVSSVSKPRPSGHFDTIFAAQKSLYDLPNRCLSAGCFDKNQLKT